ncbi:IS4 family transposase [Streptomyces sp. NPDC059629]|uniref:IS4 family transposase n=1 Tax=Streptomyces sp. NPDC059629 TaxID=3346889 RepID=UPI0036C6F624
MHVQSGMPAIGRSAFVAGHLGELTQIITPQLVDEVLVATRRVQKRVRKLPSRVVVYFVLVMMLFPSCGYAGVWASMTAGLRLRAVEPSAAALRAARRRVGVEPLALLFARLRGPVATAATAGAFWEGLRLVAWDATTVEAADTPDNVAVFKRHRSGHGPAGYPQVHLSALVECGTRALIDAVFGPRTGGEAGQVRGLLRSLTPGMLLLADRGYDSYALMREVADTGAHLLFRSKTRHPVPVLQTLADGSGICFLPLPKHSIRYHQWVRSGGIPPQVHGLLARVIEVTITVTTGDGDARTSSMRLLTTLLDARRYPATDLARLYHQRWEAETAFFALKATLRGPSQVLRSHHPVGVNQEIYAYLITYQALRITASRAADSAGLDPDRLSFIVALRSLRNSVISTSCHTGSVTAALLDPRHLHPARRRARTSPRTVKRTLSPYAYNKPKGGASWAKRCITTRFTVMPRTSLTNDTSP